MNYYVNCFDMKNMFKLQENILGHYVSYKGQTGSDAVKQGSVSGQIMIRCGQGVKQDMWVRAHVIQSGHICILHRVEMI